MRLPLSALVGVLMLAAPARAADVWITVASDPPGARIYWTSPGLINQHELAFGPAPQRIKIELDPNGCVYTNAIRVRWVSGVEASLPTVWVCKKGPRPGEPLLFIRPSVPGLETDARYAMDLALARLAWAPPQYVPPPYVPQPVAAAPAFPLIPVRCTSHLVGTSVSTTCY